MGTRSKCPIYGPAGPAKEKEKWMAQSRSMQTGTPTLSYALRLEFRVHSGDFAGNRPPPPPPPPGHFGTLTVFGGTVGEHAYFKRNY